MAAHQAPQSLGFSRQEHWSELPFPSPMHQSENWKWSRSVASDSSGPHGLQSTRLLRPWAFPGKSTGVGCHRLLRVFVPEACNCLNSFYSNFFLTDRFLVLSRAVILLIKHHTFLPCCCVVIYVREPQCGEQPGSLLKASDLRGDELTPFCSLFSFLKHGLDDRISNSHLETQNHARKGKMTSILEDGKAS